MWPLIVHNPLLEDAEHCNRRLDFQGLCQEYIRYEKEWKDAKTNDKNLDFYNDHLLQDLIASYHNNFSQTPITQCIGLGFGKIGRQFLIPKYDTPGLQPDQKARKQVGDRYGTHHQIRNDGLHQMLVFKKILDILSASKKHSIKEVYIVDDDLNDEEGRFIEEKFKWTPMKDEDCWEGSRKLLEKSCSTTFLFCPAVSQHRIRQHVGTNWPALYLGTRIDIPLTVEEDPVDYQKANRHSRSFGRTTEGEPFVEVNKMSWAGTSCHLRWPKGAGK